MAFDEFYISLANGCFPEICILCLITLKKGLDLEFSLFLWFTLGVWMMKS